MRKTTRLARSLALPILLGLSLSACALGRDAVDVKLPVSVATDSRAFVKIVAVEDNRVFEESPSDAGIPSLKDSDDIHNKKITAQAVARKRNGYGMAMGDIVLDGTTTVADLVRAAAQKALQDKGYAVVNEGAPEYANAAPLSIDIKEFWSWIAPGFISLTMEFKSTVVLSGDRVITPGNGTAISHVKQETAAGFTSVWVNLMQQGVSDLSDQIGAHIKPAPASAMSAPST